MAVEIQLAGQKDLPVVNELRRRVSGSSDRFLRHPTQHLLVAVFGSEIVGTVGLEYHGRYALLRDLFVAKSYRRRGIGTALVRRCLAICGREEIRGVYLLTYFWNMRFFCPLGFRLFRSRQGLPEEIADSWQFRLKDFNRCISLGLELD